MVLHDNKRRSGFTLVELLVVIAIIGILVALLLPAIQAAREAARRTQCKNNEKNFGLAILNHVDTFKVFPTGGARYVTATFGIAQNIEGGKPLGPDRQGLSWGFQILPYLEEGNVYHITTTADLEKVVLGVYVCPSRRAPTISYSPGFDAIIATMDYAAAVPCTWISPARTQSYDPNYAVPLSVRGIARNYSSFYGGTATSGADPKDNGVYDGVIVRCPWRWLSTDPTTGKQLGQAVANTQGLVKVAQITDGTSKTMMVAEKYIRSDNYEASAAHYSDDRGWTDGWDADLLRSTCFTPVADSDPIGWDSTLASYFVDTGSFGNNIFNVFQFGSAHAGGFNAVFADGSVHTISYDVDAVIFNNLGARNDGASFDSSSFN